MKFKKALKAMKEGKTVARHAWTRYTARLETPPERASNSMHSKCIVWSGGDDGDFWLVDVGDYEAVDWYIVEEGCGDAVPANENL